MAGRFSVEAVFSAIDKVTAPVTRMQNAVGKMTRSVERGLRSVTAVTNSAVKGITSATGTVVKFGVAGFGLLAGAVALVTREFSKIENAEASFTPLMGGAERAKALVDALNATAASTPFQFENLADAAGQLLPVMNGDIERTIRTLRMLGDTAGGNAQKLDSITRGFTKAMLKGKVDMESLNMIGEAGVPIFEDLAAVMGVKVNASFFKMISAGKVTTKQLEAAFARMTSAGGKFHNGMDIASRTTSGLWSTLMDNISLTAAGIGEVLSPTVKEVIGALTEAAQRAREWVAANRELIQSRVTEFVERIKRGVSGFIDYLVELNRKQSILDRIADGFGKVADGIDWLVAHGSELLTLTKWVAGLVIGLNVLVGVLTLVNIAMAANPIGLIVIGIAAAIAAISALIIYADELLAIFRSAPQWVQNVGTALASMAAAAAALVLGVKTLSAVTGVLNLVMAANPIGLIVIAITAAIAAIAAMVVYVDELLGMFEKAPTWLRVMLAPLELVLRTIKLIKDNWDSIVSGGKKFAAFLGFDVAEPPTQTATAASAMQAPAAAQRFTENVLAPAVNVTSPVVSSVLVQPPQVTVAAPNVAIEAPAVNAAPVLLRAPQATQVPTFGQPPANDEQDPPAAGPVMVTPQERVSRSIEERNTNMSSSAEVTLRDETGRAEVTRGKLSSNIKLKSTGRF